LLISWWLQGSAVDRIQQASPQKTLPPEITPLPARTVPQLQLIQSGALFHSTRAFYVRPPAPAVPVDLKPPPPAYRVATVLMPSRQPPVAFLTDAQGKGVLKVYPGDTLAGWTVQSIAPRRVTLVFQGDRIDLGPRLLSSVQSSSGSTVGISASGVAPDIRNSPGPASGGLRVLGGSAVAGGGSQAVAPRVFVPPPR
jgi:hypothetical protein